MVMIVSTVVVTVSTEVIMLFALVVISHFLHLYVGIILCCGGDSIPFF